jgi:phospholipid/cholesterol/gamma-HCH transport system substrate-binding protein
LLTRLDNFVGTLDAQRNNIVASIEGLNRLANTFAGQRDVITRALHRIPPALDVLIRERPQLTTALEKLGDFSDIAARLANDSTADLVKNLQNLEPTVRALADIGPELDAVLGYLTIFPYTQSFLDRGIRGDYYNLFATVDFTVPRLKRSLFRGTRWEQEGAKLVPAPGDPYYLNYTYDPLISGVVPPPPEGAPAPPPGAAPMPPMPTVNEPIVPVAPPPPMPGAPMPAPPGPDASIFAGPYPADQAASVQGAPPAVAPPVPPTPGGG